MKNGASRNLIVQPSSAAAKRGNELIEEYGHAVIDLWPSRRWNRPRSDLGPATADDFVAVDFDEFIQHDNAPGQSYERRSRPRRSIQHSSSGMSGKALAHFDCVDNGPVPLGSGFGARGLNGPLLADRTVNTPRVTWTAAAYVVGEWSGVARMRRHDTLGGVRVWPIDQP